MKLVTALFLTLSLQVAISPLCLCLGGGEEEEVTRGPCCHVPAGGEEKPCPHCDQEMPLAATAPLKGDFSVPIPEWHGFVPVPGLELLDALREPGQLARAQAVADSDPPPVSRRVVFGVFLI